MTMGRPKRPPHKRLSEVLQFRATEAEADVLYRNALRARISLSEYIRERLAGVLQCAST